MELEGDRDGAGHRQKGERDEKGKKGGHTMTVEHASMGRYCGDYAQVPRVLI